MIPDLSELWAAHQYPSPLTPALWGSRGRSAVSSEVASGPLLPTCSHLSPAPLLPQTAGRQEMSPSPQVLSHLLHTDRLPLRARLCRVATWEEQVSTDNFTV